MDGLVLNLAIEEDSAGVASRKKSGRPNIRHVLPDIKKGSWMKRRMAAKSILRKRKPASAKGPVSKPIVKADTAPSEPHSAPQASTSEGRVALSSAQSFKVAPIGSSNATLLNEKRTFSALASAATSVADDRPYKRPKGVPQKGTTGQGFISSLFSGGPEQTGDADDETATNALKSKKVLGFAAWKAKTQEEKEMIKKADNEIIEAAPVFEDQDTFMGIGVDAILCRHLSSKLGFVKPTIIQKASIPILLNPTHSDAIIQAQTGSGKTLAFLLPILHGLIRSAARQASHPSTQHMFSRNAGTFAIILAPTRELAHQISEVLDSLLKYSLQDSHAEAMSDQGTSAHSNLTSSKQQQAAYYRHWIVSSIVVGGEKRKSEKARLRKGVNVLVCTPGRLLDHLKTTDSFDVSNLRWLILDEADNLLHLGFEETLREILKILDTKRDIGLFKHTRVHVPGWPRGRQTVLCSATIEAGVKRLAEYALVQPHFIRVGSGKASVSTEFPAVSEEKPVATAISLAVDSSKPLAGSTTTSTNTNNALIKINPVSQSIANGKDDKIVSSSTGSLEKSTNGNDAATIPSQLKQFYVVAPPKLRLVTLIALLRRIISLPGASKVIVFLATGDSVDWHFDSFAHALDPNSVNMSGDSDSEDAKNTLDLVQLKAGIQPTGLFPDVRLFKLHGSMPHLQRQATFAGFCATSNSTTSIMLCTDVAARGLDLPDVAHIVQYDPPGEVRDYIHRIGRTARLGRQGAATLFLLPTELLYLDILKPVGCHLTQTTNLIELLPQYKFGGVLDPLVSGGGGAAKHSKRKTFEVVATDLHMAFERYTLSSPSNLQAAQKAYMSQIRSYATHTAKERHIFHIKNLHLGHLAKSFALREAPTGVAGRLGLEALGKQKMGSKEGQPVSAGLMKRRAVQMASRALTSEFADGDAVNLMRRRK
ncbi:hypothetical protein BASA50_005277 [Batrachochytrium salamandrivorans]|uniref:ATP-dependent RNA helicase n=1 Tax=Batrachochytrium salamandrivorans TaxID=1357716 RepID=A0ABQ8FG23_9FUNG|nr:hypothetical protein BASA60_009655 [Batrachochytrium salamandrivorans]KAH6577907.1 hypothetical protein BASA62_000615 [Batrachochytrium salamandrivorans]KAH6589836.1 hypothetical protein BASA61_005479 [Batrachochytrium salamandrivorans]KAH6596236.1 hypothetical protein BASA50_005277 [Batrachochytrium salamandrivorans]KAH9272108.1 hypothetical protein BASA83_005697 [Batrachochytrium salamandrivorans]